MRLPAMAWRACPSLLADGASLLKLRVFHRPTLHLFRRVFLAVEFHLFGEGRGQVDFQQVGDPDHAHQYVRQFVPHFPPLFRGQLETVGLGQPLEMLQHLAGLQGHGDGQVLRIVVLIPAPLADELADDGSQFFQLAHGGRGKEWEAAMIAEPGDRALLRPLAECLGSHCVTPMA